MRVANINAFFKKVGVFQIKHRIIILSILTVLTAISCLGLTKFKMASSEEEWFSDWEKVKINQDHFEDIFGNDDSLMILVEAEDVFAPEVLDAIDRLGKRLVEEVPFAEDVTSLMTLSISQGTEDGFNVIKPFEDGIPTDSAELKEKKDFILSRESLVNKIVSDDAKETWVLVSLMPYNNMVEDQLTMGRAAREIILSKDFESPAYTLKPTGMGYTEVEEDDVINHECAVRIVAGFIVMLICLILFVRSLRGVIVPVIATVGGIGSVLGIMSYLNITADSSLITLPILLGMALSVGYSIHYINSFRMYFRKTGKRTQSVIKSVEETGWPILFTVITTAASLVSFLIAGIAPIRWVGECSASIVFAVYIYVIVLIPILMSFGKDRQVVEETQKSNGATKTDLAFRSFGSKIISGRVPVVICSLVVIAIMIPGIFRISVNMDYVEMMGERIDYIKRLKEILNSKLGSQYSYDVMIEFDEEDAFKKVENMKALDSLEQYLGTLPQTRISSNKPRVTSVTSIVKEMNRAFNADLSSAYIIPEEQDVLSQLVEFCGIMQGEDMENWLDDEYRITHLHVELNGYSANQIVEDINAANAKASSLFPSAKTCVVGEVVNFAEMNHKLVSGELKSFAGSFVIIAILLILAFSSIRTGLIGMIPNITPVIIIGGVMGYFNMSLDMLTMTIMPMILGIAVDDTIHFTNHVKFYFEKTGSYKESILASFTEIGKTMGMTTFILCAMFLMYTFSPMNTLFRIGLLAMIGLASALVADYTLTPALIYITKPFGKETSMED